MKRHLLLLIVALSGLAAQTQTELVSRLDQIVDQRFVATRCPGLTITVAKANEIVYSSAHGFADLEADIRLTRSSIHRLGSVSKPITGTIIMDLVARGKLKLDEPIRTYLPELPSTYADVTLRQLLDHQSGVILESEAIFFDMTHYSTSRVSLKAFMNSPLKFKPGTATEYSSQGVTVAGAAAESATGQSFQQLSADFFASKGLSGISLDNNFRIVRNRVHGYLVDRDSKIEIDGKASSREYLNGTSGVITNAREYDISNRYPAGGFLASGDDLMRFVLAVGSGKVLPPAVLNEMWTAQKTSDATETVFGIGWGVSKWNGRSMVGMNGATPSTTALLRYFPAEGVGAVVLCNAEGAQDLSDLMDDLLQTTFDSFR